MRILTSCGIVLALASLAVALHARQVPTGFVLTHVLLGFVFAALTANELTPSWRFFLGIAILVIGSDLSAKAFYTGEPRWGVDVFWPGMSAATAAMFTFTFFASPRMIARVEAWWEEEGERLTEGLSPAPNSKSGQLKAQFRIQAHMLGRTRLRIAAVLALLMVPFGVGAWSLGIVAGAFIVGFGVLGVSFFAWLLRLIRG